MHPVADEGGLSVTRALALGDLGLVMGEDVVDAAAVDVDGLAEKSGRHGAALDVPSGTPLSPRALPSDGSILGDPGLPEGEVGDGFLLVLVARNPLSGALSLQIDMGELSVIREGCDAEIEGAILGLIGVAALHERGDHRNHPGDLLGIGGRRIGLRGEEAQGLCILEEGLLEGTGVVAEGHAGGMGSPDRLVVDIREVHHAADHEAPLAEMTLEEILEDVGPEVADMGVGVDGRAARVEGEGLTLAGAGRDRLKLAAEGVVNLNGTHRLFGRRFDGGRCESGDSFSSSEETEALVGRRLHSDP